MNINQETQLQPRAARSSGWRSAGRPLLSVLALLTLASLHAQSPEDPDGPPPFPPGPPPGGPGPMRPELKLVPQFDKNGDKRLDRAERTAAREFVQKQRADGPRRMGPGGPRGPGRGPGPGPGRGPGRGPNATPPQPGPRVSPTEVTSFTNAPLYEPWIVRTLFLQFEQDDWEKELADFHNTDVEIPAQLTVDGRTYAGVGVHFRGASSFMMVGEGSKRSLNVSLDFLHKDQRLYGHRTLNLLNSHEDPSFLRTVLYAHIARTYIAAPAANFVRVIINGESWGVYVSAEQFNKDSTKEWFGSTQGARWKAPGRPNGDAGLSWLGADPAEYKRRYEIKSKDNAASWSRLIELCRVLDQTPPDRLERALAPILDVDGTLKFLALENVLVNNDGYWVRASDYSLYLDDQGRFHLIPHDTNETFSRPGGPGFGRGPGGRRFGGRPPGPDQGLPEENRPEISGGGPPDGPGRGPGARINGVELDPLFAAKDSSKPLLSKLLAVPALRARYFSYVRDIATRWLDWRTLGPLAQRYQSVIAAEVKLDTRKFDSFEEFTNGLAGATQAQPAEPAEAGRREFRGPGPKMSLQAFAEQRRAYLLNHAEVKQAAALPVR